MKHLKKLVISILLMTIGTGLAFASGRSEGNGILSTTERILSPFEKVNISGSVNVRFHTDNEYRAIITIDSNLEEYVVLDINNKELKIRLRNRRLYSYTTFIVDIYCPTISGISVSGSGTFSIMDQIITETFDARISGSGSISGRIEADDIYINISGSGSIDSNIICDNISSEILGAGSAVITGNSNNANIGISGSGEFNGIDLQTKIADIRISGAGRTNIWVLEKITANVSGSGNIRYRGNPIIDFSGSGSGRIMRE